MFKIKIVEPHRELNLEVGDYSVEDMQIEIQSQDESELQNSTKFRTKLKRAVRALYSEFRDQTRMYVRAILHNTGNTEVLIRQTIERYTHKIPYGTSHADRIEKFSEIIAKDPKKFAENLVFLEQRAVDLDAQLIGMSILIGRPFDQTTEEHHLQPLLWRCFQPFYEILKAHSIYIEFNNLESKKIHVDFRLFNCGMYHFFDNIQKYIKQDSHLYISTSDDNREILFKMISRSLDENEKEKIFDESYSGRNAGSQKGEGFGMFIFAQVLNKMNAKPSVTWKETAQVQIEGHPYREQVFSIRFPENVIS